MVLLRKEEERYIQSKEYRMTFLDVLRDPQGSGIPREYPEFNYKRLWSTPFVPQRGVLSQ